jgi:protoporphyrinogen oxidase
MSERQETAIIIGAGPAGLTAAYELLTRTNIKPMILEAAMEVGGISRTVNYKGNRIDIGGHRFFSKSDRIMAWWQRMMPVYIPSTGGIELRNVSDDRQNTQELHDGSEVNNHDPVMLVRTRLSRILFLRKFFDYPISLSLNTIRNMGLYRLFKVALSYAWVCLTPRRSEKSLEDFFINRFGREL